MNGKLLCHRALKQFGRLVDVKLDISMIETWSCKQQPERSSVISSMTVRGRHDDGILDEGVVPGSPGSATGGWRENLLVLGTGRIIGLYGPPKITYKSRSGP